MEKQVKPFAIGKNLREKFVILNVFSYAYPLEEVVERCLYLARGSKTLLQADDWLFEKLLTPEINTLRIAPSFSVEEMHWGYINSILYLPAANEDEDDTVATCSHDMRIIFWNLRTHEQLSSLKFENAVGVMARVRDSIAFAASGQIGLVSIATR